MHESFTMPSERKELTFSPPMAVITNSETVLVLCLGCLAHILTQKELKNFFPL